ncbi:MAG: radical SAM protein [bacterium]
MAEEIRYGFAGEADAAFPPMTHVVVTNACNLECTHCAYGEIKNRDDYRPAYLDWGLFARIADEIAAHPGAILRFTCDGEPMLHPRFFEMAEYAKKKNLRPTVLNTNGTLLDDGRIERLMDTGIDVVEVSLNSFSPETYRALRPGRGDGEYEEIVRRVNALVERRDRTKSRTKIMVSMIVLPETEKEAEPFERYWRERVDRVIIRVFTNFGGLVKGKSERGDTAKRRPCLVPWRRTTVTSDGRIRYCFNDWCSQSVLFDMNDGTTLEEAWRSGQMEKLRRDHLELNFRDWPYCGRCTTWSILRWDHDYGKALMKVLED